MAEKRTVLIIEDNAINRDLLTFIMEEKYQVLAAENGAEGLAVLKEKGSLISLILLDIQMPVMNGYEFLEAMAKEQKYADIPVIVATASDSDQEQIRCLELGAYDFVTKPYKAEIVQRRAAGLIRLKETSLALHKVERDAMSGLYNREAFAFRVQEKIKASPEAHFDMVCFEIESFLSLQGRYGVETCATAMRNIAEYLERTTPEDAILGRIDNAQIAAFFLHMSEEEHKERSAKYIRDDFSRDIPAIYTNVGVYLNVDPALSVPGMLANAIAPLGSVRYQYDKFLAFYDESLRKKADEAERLTATAEEAIQNKQFQVYYQPKHSALRSKAEGAEALVRWIHPEFGFISPGAFIPVFETNGFITKLDLYVVETVAANLRKWMDEGKPVVPVSTNISQMDFDDPNLPDVLEAIVDRYAVPHALIHFEITESASASDKEKKATAVKKMQAKGFAIELDDFGSGYSNLTTLTELPIDVLKLDMSLIRNMFEPDRLSLLRGTLFLAYLLQKKVVCEGVETKEQAEKLIELCSGRVELYFQGYYCAKPLPIDQFEAHMAIYGTEEKR